MIQNHERKQIKQTAKDRNLTDAIFHECLSAKKMPLAGLARKWSAEHPKAPTTAQNITNKIARDSLKLREFVEYLELIGFDLMIVPREETPDASHAPEEASEDKPLTVGEIKNYESVTISEKTAEDLEKIATYTSYDLFMRGGIGVFEFPLDTEDGDKLDEEINTPMIDIQDLQRMLKIAFLYGMREGRK